MSENAGTPAGTPGWDDVLALVAQLDASGLADAEVVVPGLSVRVSRTVLDPAAASAAVAAPAPAAVEAPVAAAAVDGEGEPVTAPMLGVFYRRPAPDRPPFVEVGDTVMPDTTVAILEVMKLMNPVTAGVSGVVTEICVPDGRLVEHGDVLLRVRATG